MIAGLLALIDVAMVTFPAAEDRWLVLRGEATATVALDRSSVIQGRHQKLWVRVKWTAIRDGVVYSDWLENFDCDTQSSFPSRIIEYAADGTILREMEGDADLMSIIHDANSVTVRDAACGAPPSTGARNGN